MRKRPARYKTTTAVSHKNTKLKHCVTELRFLRCALMGTLQQCVRGPHLNARADWYGSAPLGLERKKPPISTVGAKGAWGQLWGSDDPPAAPAPHEADPARRVYALCRRLKSLGRPGYDPVRELVSLGSSRPSVQGICAGKVGTCRQPSGDCLTLLSIVSLVVYGRGLRTSTDGDPRCDLVVST